MPNTSTPKDTVAARVADLEERVAALESVLEAARQRQQQELAKKLAANPEQLAQMQAVLKLAQAASGDG